MNDDKFCGALWSDKCLFQWMYRKHIGIYRPRRPIRRSPRSQFRRGRRRGKTQLTVTTEFNADIAMEGELNGISFGESIIWSDIVWSIDEMVSETSAEDAMIENAKNNLN